MVTFSLGTPGGAARETAAARSKSTVFYDLTKDESDAGEGVEVVGDGGCFGGCLSPSSRGATGDVQARNEAVNAFAKFSPAAARGQRGSVNATRRAAAARGRRPDAGWGGQHPGDRYWVLDDGESEPSRARVRSSEATTRRTPRGLPRGPSETVLSRRRVYNAGSSAGTARRSRPYAVSQVHYELFVANSSSFAGLARPFGSRGVSEPSARPAGRAESPGPAALLDVLPEDGATRSTRQKNCLRLRDGAARRPGRGALLFVDISGFTRLSTSLGIEALKRHINAIYTRAVDVSARDPTTGTPTLAETSPRCFKRETAPRRLVPTQVDIIAKHGGDVLKFAGDAMLILWLAAPEGLAAATERAASCALALQGPGSVHHVKEEGVDGEKVDVQLSMHIALGCGDCVLYRLGDRGRPSGALTSRGDAAAAIFLRRIAATPRPRRGYSFDESRRRRGRATWLFSDESRRRRDVPSMNRGDAATRTFLRRIAATPRRSFDEPRRRRDADVPSTNRGDAATFLR